MTSKSFTIVFNKNNEIIVNLEIFHPLMVVHGHHGLALPYRTLLWGLSLYIGPPIVYVTPTNVTAVENTYSNIVLSCNCGCSIRPYWFKNSQLIHFNKSQSQYTLLANGSLHINISRVAAGHYSCEVRWMDRTHYWSVRSEHVGLEVWCKYDNFFF
jgi:hypothetical protein